MKKIILILFTLVYTFCFCQNSEVIKTATFEGFIFNKNYSEYDLLESNRFTPSTDDIIKIENSITAHQKKVCNCNLKRYVRQYIGYTQNNDSIIVINFILKKYIKKNAINLSEKLFDSSRTNSTFRQLKINLVTGELYEKAIEIVIENKKSIP